VNDQWRYLYRTIDHSGALVDVRLGEKRDMAAAKAFFRSAKAVTGVTPARVTTDGHDSYPRAIRTELDAGVKHRTNQYLNNRIEQDHRGIKGRYGPMRGFKSHETASRFSRCFDELRNHLQARSRRSRNLPTNARRHRFLTLGIVALRILECGLITGSAVSLDPSQWRDRWQNPSAVCRYCIASAPPMDICWRRRLQQRRDSTINEHWTVRPT
jgi:hypothetical protein